jgi:SAM-dependent methyltransferase
MLLLILRSHGYLFVPPAKVLDIAPARSVRNFLVPLVGSRYIATDLFEMPGIVLRSDLTKTGFADDSFDVIICYHVLEHIPDDGAAISELARILKPGGIAFIQVPRRPGTATDEDPSAPEDERVRRFGQSDHVRYYGDDLEQRLRANGLLPTTVRPAGEWPASQIRRFGLQQQEEIWICRAGNSADPGAGPSDGSWQPPGLIRVPQGPVLVPFVKRTLSRTALGRAALRGARSMLRR